MREITIFISLLMRSGVKGYNCESKSKNHLKLPKDVFTSLSSLRMGKTFKGTVSVISSDPSCKDYNVRFATMKALSDQVHCL